MGAREMFELVDCSVDEWGGEAPYGKQPEREGNDQVFVHHPGFPIREAADRGNLLSERAVLRDIESSAMKRGWWGIQYDVCVGQSGTIYEGRGLARSGATSGDVDDDGTHNNTEGEAILVMVRPGTEMTDECKASLARLLDAHGGDVYGHQEASTTGTSCPGDDRMAFIESYRKADVPEEKPKAEAPKKEEPKSDPAPKKTPAKQDWTETIMASLGVHKRGDRRSIQVKRLQALLNASGMFHLKEDGVFGRRTEQAVEEYQQHFRLAVDGVVGQRTWRHLLTSNY